MDIRLLLELGGFAALLGAVVFTLLRRIDSVRRDARANLERALLSERVFSRSFNASPIPLALLDLDTRALTEVNAAFEMLVGFRRDELLGRTMAELGIEDTDGQRTLLRRVRRNGLLRAHTTRLTRKDGKVRDVMISMDVFSVGDATHALATILDQTDARRLKELQEQLRQAQKMESLGMLAGGIAHDFNNMLAVVSSCSGLLTEELGREHPAHELVEDIADAVVRASALTRQLLAFSRKQVTEPVVLDLNIVVNDIRKLLRRMVGVDIELVTSLDPELRPVFMDRGHLVQVLINLGVNARDAMNGRGTLRLATRNVGADVVLEVVDNGSGMTPEVRARACEPFFTTKEPGKGTGMGLAVVHGIVDSARGRVEIDSEPGTGTTFRIVLPAFEGAAQVQRVSGGDGGRGVETILLVDDDDYVRKATARALRSRGYTVHEAAGGRIALALLQIEHVDLLLTDIVMPEMSGRVLADAATSRFPHLRVLYITGYTNDEIVHTGVLAGRVELLEKPFSNGALAAKVRAVLDAELPTHVASVPGQLHIA